MSSSQVQYIMFYNVENLYAPQGKDISRHVFHKSGLRNWTEERYHTKINKLAKVFSYFQIDHGHLPIMVGLAEIENDRVLEDLLEKGIFQDQYAYVHYDSLDERGVDTALIYNKTILQLLDSEVYTQTFAESNKARLDTTRDILYCKMLHLESQEELHVYVIHLPSQRKGGENEVKRSLILGLLQKIIQDKLDINPKEKIIVMGDFNENPDNNHELNLIKGKSFDTILRNPFIDLYARGCFSTFYRDKGLLFDQILLSDSLFNQNEGLEYSDSEVYNSPHLIDRSYKRKNLPFRTYAGTRYLGGYSDHFPVFVKVKIKK
ncbi:endonuclease [Elizabethkingia sp. JS20170427COW]|uniref:endonuclease/exonuclease/phosphatase family protein n=1 Tax=Elizabethkingia sp. JS20170427COW TaxID=2583851 RepID=UPI001110AB20|nr:endonuclease [Elizabethkingia sp. JS20170427COW]QCX54131.1 endonuclease [Elizabethkingia sp. JS20170427COW]